ncbi:hypothetical protein A5721_00005 [Mycobacterium vulneris]|nr:hypothetical protein A5721_00005 [Mycolicibacterium vulneris]
MAENLDTSTADFTPLFDTGENEALDEQLSAAGSPSETPSAEDMTPDETAPDAAETNHTPASTPTNVHHFTDR